MLVSYTNVPSVYAMHSSSPEPCSGVRQQATEKYRDRISEDGTGNTQIDRYSTKKTRATIMFSAPPDGMARVSTSCTIASAPTCHRRAGCRSGLIIIGLVPAR